MTADVLQALGVSRIVAARKRGNANPWSDADTFHFEPSEEEGIEAAQAESDIALACLYGPTRAAKVALAVGLTPTMFSLPDCGAILAAVLRWYRDAADLIVTHGTGLTGAGLTGFMSECVAEIVAEELRATGAVWWTNDPTTGAAGAWHPARVRAALITPPPVCPYSQTHVLAGLMQRTVAVAGRRGSL